MGHWYRRLVLISVVVTSSALPAAAAELRQTLDGGRLLIQSPCARQVTVVADPGLSGKIAFVAIAEHPEELAHLRAAGGAVATLGHSGSCWHPLLTFGFKPTLTLVIQVPSAFGVAVYEEGYGTISIGSIGPLKVTASGSVTVRADQVTTLDVRISGSGDVAVQSADGDGKVAIAGSGAVSVGTAKFTSLALVLSGQGSFKLDGGTIGTLDLNSSGVGQVAIGATVGDAQVDVSGVGRVSLASVTGKLEKQISGVGSVTVGGQSH